MYARWNAYDLELAQCKMPSSGAGSQQQQVTAIRTSTVTVTAAATVSVWALKHTFLILIDVDGLVTTLFLIHDFLFHSVISRFQSVVYIIMCINQNHLLAFYFHLQNHLFAWRCNLRNIYLFLCILQFMYDCCCFVFWLFAWIQTICFVVDFVSMCISCICVHICRVTIQVTWIDRQISYCISFKWWTL